MKLTLEQKKDASASFFTFKGYKSIKIEINIALAGVFIAYYAINIIAKHISNAFQFQSIFSFQKAIRVQKRPHLPHRTDLDG